MEETQSPGTAGPPLESLLEVHRLLVRAGIVHALGGGGLLHALGLMSHARDWDLTTGASREAVAPLLATAPHERFEPHGVHADHKIQFHDGTVELIPQMAFRSPAGVGRISTILSGEWNAVPLGSPGDLADRLEGLRA